MNFPRLIPISLATAAFIVPAGTLFAARPATQKPNVIFIYADDMGKGMLSAFGQKQFKTPNIDKLVRGGVSFNYSYGCMLSAPARASLITGYSDCHGRKKWQICGGGQFIGFGGDEETIEKKCANIDKHDVNLPKGDLYLAQVFKKAGYATGQIGKLEWGFTATPTQMKNHGWDYYYGYLDHVRCHGFYPPFLFENGKVVKIDGNTRENCGKTPEGEGANAEKIRRDMDGKKTYSQELFDEKLIAYIRKNKDKPFFLYHPSQLPHGPVQAPKIDPRVEKVKGLTNLEKEYATMMIILDDTVGKILAELKKQKIEKNTIVVFSSDNGHEIYTSQPGRTGKYHDFKNNRNFDDLEHKYRGDLNGDVFDGTAGMAGLKRSNLEGGVHVPLVFYWPGTLKTGTRNDVVSNYDFLPTMAEMVGLKRFGEKDGVSYWKTLLDEKKHLPKDRCVFFGANTGPGVVENSGWKLRKHNKFNAWELFNVREDLFETKNLIEQNPAKAEELKKKLLDACDGDYSNGINRAG